MDFINGNTKVIDAVYGILKQELYPVIVTKTKYYYLDITHWGRGTLMYTEFDRDTMLPVASWELRFASYHTLRHVIMEPVPKIQLDKLLMTEIPDLMPDEVDPEIILSYYRN